MDIAEDFKHLEKLYHYTSFEKGLLILYSKRLLFGSLSSMNDIHENSKILLTDVSTDYQKVNCEINKYKQLSFTIDKSKKGFDLQQLWGNYADKAKGLCLVYDKNEVIKKLGKDDTYEKVNYKKDIDSSIYVKSEINKKVFFTKRVEWKYEQEFRIIRKCNNPQNVDYMDVSPKYIIISGRFHNEDIDLYWKRINQLKEFNIDILEYGFGLLSSVYMLSTIPDDEGKIKTVWTSKNDYNIISENEYNINLKDIIK